MDEKRHASVALVGYEIMDIRQDTRWHPQSMKQQTQVRAQEGQDTGSSRSACDQRKQLLVSALYARRLVLVHLLIAVHIPLRLLLLLPCIKVRELDFLDFLRFRCRLDRVSWG